VDLKQKQRVNESPAAFQQAKTSTRCSRNFCRIKLDVARPVRVQRVSEANVTANLVVSAYDDLTGDDSI
jgi:hypothetical protein